MSLQIYDVDRSEEWDSVVRSFKDYDTFWLSGYAKGFKIHGDGEPLLFYYEDMTTRGINVVMKRDVSQDIHFEGKIEKKKYFDFTSPYGYGGWIIEGENSQKLFQEYEMWCEKNEIICEFIRFHPVIENHKFSENYYEVIPLGNTIAIDLSSPEKIWNNFKSTCRTRIRKAQKSGVRIYKGQYKEIYSTFKSIYNETMIKDHAQNYYFFGDNYFTSVLEDLPNNAQVFYAIYEGKVISAAIMLMANGKMSYHLSGTLTDYLHLSPNNLLLYEAALWGYENRCKTLYLGGGLGSAEDDLFRYKKTFYQKGDAKRFYIGKKTYIQSKYDELLSLREPIESGFFPMYRA